MKKKKSNFFSHFFLQIFVCATMASSSKANYQRWCSSLISELKTVLRSTLKLLFFHLKQKKWGGGGGGDGGRLHHGVDPLPTLCTNLRYPFSAD